MLIRGRQFDAALNEARIRVEAQPNNADLHALLSAAYYYKGMEKESEQESERNLQIMGEKELAAEAHEAFRRGGLQAVLEWNLKVYQQRASKQYVTPTSIAGGYAQLKRKEETLRHLEQAYTEHAPNMVWLQSIPEFDFVHSDPRYCTIIKKMRLPPNY
jgi:tetratricopeptide (TPR) repeat protein